MSKLRDIRKARGLNLIDVADILGVTETSVSRYEREDQRLDLPLMRRLAKILNCTVGEIAGDKVLPHLGNTSDHPPEAPPNYERVKHLDFAAHGGVGGIVEHEDFKVAYFRAELIRHVLHARPEDLVYLPVDGDSMAPTLEDGDEVLIDLRRRAIGNGGVFLARLDGMIVVKRLEPIYGTERLAILSDNPRYRPQEQPAEAVHVIGKVVWFARRLG